MVGRKENRRYLTGFLHIKENAQKITRSKTLEIQELITWGSRLGQEKDKARRVGRRLWYEKQGSDFWGQ